MNCGKIFHVGYESQKNKTCPNCKSNKVRQHIVMFEEPAPMYQRLYELLQKTDLLICIGTSGQVLPIAHYMQYAQKSILNNIHKDDYIDSFLISVIMKVPKLLSIKSQKILKRL